jgi:hypothetical protein
MDNQTSNNPLAWKFSLSDANPLWAWALFIIALGLLLKAWSGVLRLMD